VWYLLALAMFALSLMAKPMLVTLPVLMLILDWWPLRRLPTGEVDGSGGLSTSSRSGLVRTAIRLCAEKLPFLAMSAVSSVITIIAQHRSGSVESLESLSVGARLSNATISYFRYLEKTIVPIDLAVLYPYPLSWPTAVVIGCSLLFAAITLTGIALARRSPCVIAGWLWYVIALLPVIGLLQTGAQAMADRYSYVPSIGVYIALVWSARAALGDQRGLIGVVAAAVIIGILGVLTRVQVHVWSGSATLYAHAVRCTDQNWIMHLKLGTEYELAQRLDEAHSQFVLAAQARPKNVESQFKVADILARQRRFAESKAAFRHVLTLNPDHVHALNNLAWLMASFPENRDLEAPDAVQLAQRAVELTDHQEISFLDTLANAYAADGRLDEAIRTARSARDLARQRGDEELAAQLDESLSRYLGGQRSSRTGPAPNGDH
jgi:hypothetical protein